MARYGFGHRLHDYLRAEAVDDSLAGSKLPISVWGQLRASRLGGRERAREFRLVVIDQCAEIRKAISENGPEFVLTNEVKILLKLLGEYDEAE